VQMVYLRIGQPAQRFSGERFKLFLLPFDYIVNQ